MTSSEIIRSFKSTMRNLLLTSVTNEDGQSAAQLRLLTNAMPHMVWTTDAEGVPEYFNLKWFEYVGVPVDMDSFPNWTHFVYPRDREKAEGTWSYSLKSGQEFELEFRLRGMDGSYRWFLGRGVPFKDYRGQIIKWVVTCTDVHERKRNGDFSRLLAKVSEVLSSSLEFQDTIPKIIKLIVPDFASWCAVDLIEEDLSLKHFASDLTVISKGQKKSGLSSSMEVPIVARGKVLGTMSFVASQADRNFGPQDLPLAEELGRRTGLALENAKLYQAAVKAIKLRDEFLSLAAHELKTPLTSLRLQLQIAERSVNIVENTGPSPAKIGQITEKSLLQVDRLTGLVEDLLDVSRIQGGRLKFNFERFDLGECAIELVTRLRDEFQRAGCEVELDISEPVAGTWDRGRLEQIVTNLLINALKYAPGKPVKISISKTETDALLRVADQGPGISPSDKTLIFERFERVSSARNANGLGLGLFIVKQIVSAHKGTVQVEGEFGKGATFAVTLPLSPECSALTAAVPE